VVEIRARRIQFLDRKSERDVEELAAATESTDKPAAADQPVAAEAGAEGEQPKEQPKETKPAVEQIEFQKIEPTDFDFGYQDLKL
jgi:hypothetical protein